MEALFDQVVFSVGEEDYRWGDVVAAAKRWGDWDRARESSRKTLACLARFEEDEEAVPAGEIESAADEFRYARDLVSAQEMEEWLSRWGLTAEEWMDWVRGWTLRSKQRDETADLIEKYAPDEEEVESFLVTEAVCSGDLERLARKLAGMAAIHQKETGSSEQGGGDRLERLEASYRAFRERVLTPVAVEREIRSHRAEWTRLDCRRAAFREEEGAREAALCVREDGTALEQVAAGAGAEFAIERITLDGIEPPLHENFLGARKGDLVGPVKRGEEFLLYQVFDKVPPSVKEAADVERAESNLLERLVGRAIADRVKWAVLPGVSA